MTSAPSVSPPVEDGTAPEHQLRILCWGFGFALTAFQLGQSALSPARAPGNWIMIGLFDALCVVTATCRRGRRARTGAALLVASVLLLIGGLTWTGGGIRSAAIGLLLPSVALAAVLLGRRSGMVTAALAALWAAALLLAEHSRLLPPSVHPGAATLALGLVLALALLVLLLWTAELDHRPRRTGLIGGRTRQQRTEAALAASKQRLALALEASRDAVFDLDLVTGEAYCSPRYFEMLGYAADELPPSLETWRKLIHPDDRPAAEAALASFARRGTDTHQIEFRLRTKTGGWCWIFSYGRILARDAAGRPLRLIGTHVDITDRKLAEEALLRERDLVARLLETSPAGIVGVTAAGEIIFANQEAERLLRLRRSPVAGRRYAPADWQVCDPDGTPLPEEQRPFRLALATRQPIHDRRHLLTWPDGHRVLLAIHAGPLFGVDHRIEGVVAIFDDITERQRNEDLVRKNEERLRTVFDHAPFGMHLYELQPDGRLVFSGANHSADVILHIDNQALLGREIVEAFPGLRDSDLPERFRRVVREAQPFHRADVRYEAPQLSGSFEVHALPIGRHRVAVFFNDITERERAAAALRHSEEQYRLLFDAGNDALFVHGVDPSGQPTAFIEVNAIACKLLGYTRAELLARRPDDLNAPACADRAAAVLERLRHEGQALFEMELVACDGRNVPVEINSRLFSLAGRPTVLSVVRDVSERRRLEAQLRQAQKMEIFGQLAGGVAHDFNNLLVAIIGNAELVLEAPEGSPRAREQLEQILGAGRRAAALTRQLLLFARKQVAQPELCDLGAIAANHAKLLRRIIGEHIELALELAPAPLPINADVNMIEQVAMNLAVNARDAMPRGGTLTLRTERRTLDAAAAARAACPPGEYAALIVADTGTGIPDPIRPRIFEPFFTTKPSGQGTGLGLSTVLGIVQQHRGGIDLASEPERGTTFSVFLPLVAAGGPPPAAAVPPARAAAAAVILVVEDDASVRAIIERTLGKAGYHVLLASSGAEGLAQLEQGAARVDLVLSDIVMPGGMDGVELQTRIAQRWPDLPVLLMSGYAKNLDESKLRLLQKPFTTVQLLAYIQEGLVQRSADPRK